LGSPSGENSPQKICSPFTDGSKKPEPGGSLIQTIFKSTEGSTILKISKNLKLEVLSFRLFNKRSRTRGLLTKTNNCPTIVQLPSFSLSLPEIRVEPET
jgi:hypothetical protein